jgi:hypothetical protein
MDVHAPHGEIHTWREFFVHLIIITLGLLIALGLEGTVEWFHERHLLHTAEANLRAELQRNQASITADLKALDDAQKQAESNLVILKAYRVGKGQGQKITISWQWSGPSSAAWDTARNTGAVALMDYRGAQQYSDTYLQQSIASDEAAFYLRDLNLGLAPMMGGGELADVKPEELDRMTVNVEQTLADVLFLRSLCAALARDYDETLRQP